MSAQHYFCLNFRQFDLRQPHSCSQSNRCSNIIVNLNSQVATASEAKCIAINPLRPEQIAVGSSDPFARLYDTRMLKLHSIHDSRGKCNGSTIDETSPPQGCVCYFAPGHIPQRYGRDHPQKYRHYVVTYLSFSPDGQEILANLGGEHAYIFDIMNPREAFRYSAKHMAHSTCNADVRSATAASCYDSHLNAAKDTQSLSERALTWKAMGNDNFSKHNYFQAVICYNHSIELAPRTAVLYANRAAAFLKRGWYAVYICLPLFTNVWYLHAFYLMPFHVFIYQPFSQGETSFLPIFCFVFVLYCIVLYFILSCCLQLHRSVLHYVAWCCAILMDVAFYCIALYYIDGCCILLYPVVLY